MEDPRVNEFKVSHGEPDFLPIKDRLDIPIRSAAITTGLAFLSGFVAVCVYAAILICNYGPLTSTGWFMLLTNLAPLTVFMAIFGMMFRTDAGYYTIAIFVFIQAAAYLISFANTAMMAGDGMGGLSTSNAWLASMLSIGPLEELCKAAIYLVPFLFGRIQFGYSVIYYAAVAGLVFGVLENLFYNYQFLRAGNPTDTVVMAATSRIYYTTVLHILLSVFGSFFLAYAMSGVWKYARRSIWWVIALAGWLAAAFVHGVYDAMILGYQHEYKAVSESLYLLLPFVVLLMFTPLRAREIAQANEQACRALEVTP